LHGGVNRITAVANDTTGVASPPSNEIVVIHQVHPPLYDVGVEPGTVAAGEEVTLWADVRGMWPLEGAPAAAAWATPPFGSPLALTGMMPSEPLWRWQATWSVPAGAASQDTIVRYAVVDEDNLTGEGEVGLAIRNAPPAPHIIWPAEDLMVTPQVVLAGRVESAAGLTVRVYEGAQILAQTRSTGWDPTVGINWQVAITLTGEGPHALRAEAVNDYGLVSALSSTRTLTLDLNPPAVMLEALPPYTNAPYLDLAWQGADAGSGVATYGLEHSLDGGPWTEWASGGAGYTAAVYPLHQDATYRFRVRARDGAGREGLSEEREIVADQTAPGLVLALDGSDPHVHVAGSTVYYGPSSGSFTVTASLGDATAGLAEVVLPDTTSAGATYALSGANNASRGQVYTFTSGSTFSAAVSVTATDRAGNVTVRPLSVVRDATPPAIQLAAVERTYTTTFQVSWWASDAGSGVATGYDLDVSEDGGPWQRILSQTTATSYWYAGQLGRNYRFRVAAVDNVGNAGGAEAETWVPVTTKYYYHGGQRVAMRSGQTGAVYYLHADHLGSTGLSTAQDGSVHSRQLYTPYGETRWTLGELPTDRQFTGQIHDAGTGLYFYNARYYDPALGRFISADTIVPGPGNPQALNRYSYVSGNPVKLIDPSGHQGEYPFPPYIWEREKLYRLIIASLARSLVDEAWEDIGVDNPGVKDVCAIYASTIYALVFPMIGQPGPGESQSDAHVKNPINWYDYVGGTHSSTWEGVGNFVNHWTTYRGARVTGDFAELQLGDAILYYNATYDDKGREIKRDYTHIAIVVGWKDGVPLVASRGDDVIRYDEWKGGVYNGTAGLIMPFWQLVLD
jgi:RHS repeat-associated protein